MRIHMVWHTQRKSLDMSSINNGSIRISEGHHLTLIHYVGECHDLNNVRDLFIQFQSKGLLVCRSIKLFEAGALPRMEEYGFTHNGTFYTNHMHDLAFLAVPYGKDEWCLQLDKRTGSGIHLRMLQLFPYFQETYKQLSLEDLSIYSA